MSEKRFNDIEKFTLIHGDCLEEMMNEKRFIRKKTTAISSNYPQGERVYDTGKVLKLVL